MFRECFGEDERSTTCSFSVRKGHCGIFVMIETGRRYTKHPWFALNALIATPFIKGSQKGVMRGDVLKVRLEHNFKDIPSII